MNWHKMNFAVAVLFGGLLLATATPQPVDQEDVGQLHPDMIKQLKIPKSLMRADVDPSLLQATGPQEVIVKLKSPPAAEQTDVEGRMSYKGMLKDEQSAFLKRTGLSAKEISRVQTLMNAVFLKIDSSEVATLAADPDVVSVHRVANYEMQLSETVPYIGATTVQNQGYDGSGVRVAVLDSGIDYTHAAFGGDGTLEAFQAAYKDFTSRDGLFPTNKVVEGYDFLGEDWPGGDIVPDNEPIDGQGHGTAVADIINSVAPGVSLYAVRVCARLAQSCSGVALMQGLEYAIDPNGDGDTSDAVDIINLSIGTPYGLPYDHDLSQAINAASSLGVLVVASAGNGGDKPYIVATASSARSALSVAQTQMPSASLQLLQAAGVDYHAVFQPWSKQLTDAIVGPLQYGDGNGGNLKGCNDFDPGSLAGKIVLVDRGECNFTLKISKITQGDGLAGVIGLVSLGDPFPGGDGDDRPIDIPGFMISKADADAIRAAGTNTVVTLDPDNRRPLAMTMVPSSSRGPQHEDTSLIKPELGAPGTSIAAVAGSGSGTAPFGGTSGAAPVVAGSAALILEKYPNLAPHEVKARLMNNGETNIRTDPFDGLAPITRIGGGEVRVDRALAARAAAFDEDTLQGALSFGFIDVFRETRTMYKRIRIRNYSNDDITYKITPTFRYPEQDFGAVSIRPLFEERHVRAGKDVVIPIILTIKGDLLTGNYMSSGEEGGSSAALFRNEYDGYVVLDDGEQPIHLAWHVLPRKAANTTLSRSNLDFTGNTATVSLTNTGVGDSQIEAFSLLAVSEDIPEGGPGAGEPTPDIRAVGIRTREDIEEGICSDTNSFIWDFAISTWERQQHLAPVAFKIFLGRNDTDEFLVVNNDISGNPVAVDGRQVTYALDLNTAAFTSGFYVDHSMNTCNIVLSVCSDQIGLLQTDLRSTNVKMEVYTQDIMYGGDGDEVVGLTVTPGAERFVASTEDLGPGQTGTVTVSDNGAFDGNSKELGVMLITNADRGPGKRGGATQGSELILLRA